jgi:geranylgeranyl pyrophosphate synthase
VSAPQLVTDGVVSALGATREIDLLRERLELWLTAVDAELREPLSSAFAGQPKYFRPLTLFACRRALGEQEITEESVELALVIELIHNMSLVVDDVLDGSELRRGVPTLQAGFGRLHALMASGYLVADAFELVAGDPFATRHVAELLRRLAGAECLQWRLRRQPLGTEDWRRIAGEDTGSMFEICAVLGGRSQQLRPYGRLLGILYHGCDDVGDQRGLEALGGGGEEDIRDGILTLPAALAIRDPRVRELFLIDDDDPSRMRALGDAYREQLPEAESVLDGVAQEACAEAVRVAVDPAPLIALVHEVRRLSTR